MNLFILQTNWTRLGKRNSRGWYATTLTRSRRSRCTSWFYQTMICKLFQRPRFFHLPLSSFPSLYKSFFFFFNPQQQPTSAMQELRASAHRPHQVARCPLPPKPWHFRRVEEISPPFFSSHFNWKAKKGKKIYPVSFRGISQAGMNANFPVNFWICSMMYPFLPCSQVTWRTLRTFFCTFY